MRHHALLVVAGALVLGPGCQSRCGTAEIQNTGMALTPLGETEEIPFDGEYFERCGDTDTYGTFTASDVMTGTIDQLRIEFRMTYQGHKRDGIVDFFFWPVFIPLERLHSEETLTADDGLSGHTGWLDNSGNTLLVTELTGGELTIGDWDMLGDPCGVPPYLTLDVEWDLEWGDVGGDEMWATYEGRDTISADWSFLCGTNWP